MSESKTTTRDERLSEHWLRRLVRRWFGFSLEVTPGEYTRDGLLLMLFKYVCEATTFGVLLGRFFSPVQFLIPSVILRSEVFEPERLPPEAMGVLIICWGLWSLPFLWIAVSMSARRAVDAGLSPWLGAMVLLPVLNLGVLCFLCLAPRRVGNRRVQEFYTRGHVGGKRTQARDALVGIFWAQVVGIPIFFLSVYWLSDYGLALFMAAPFLMGTTSVYVFNRAQSYGVMESMAVALGALAGGGVLLLMAALEGLICILMAAPLMVPVVLIGGLFGLLIVAGRPGRRVVPFLLLSLVLPMAVGVDRVAWRAAERVVESAVIVDAAPEAVWENVVSFPDLAPPDEWLFRLGIAAPMAARIEGRGVGAIRYCEFTTGEFVEPITVWDAPQRLAFDVSDQPHPMYELSPFGHIHPPHLDNGLQCLRGEFRLIRLADGRTRLEGRTWYRTQMFPDLYWGAWCDLIIHRVHKRVLEHVKTLSEQKGK